MRRRRCYCDGDVPDKWPLPSPVMTIGRWSPGSPLTPGAVPMQRCSGAGGGGGLGAPRATGAPSRAAAVVCVKPSALAGGRRRRGPKVSGLPLRHSLPPAPAPPPQFSVPEGVFGVRCPNDPWLRGPRPTALDRAGGRRVSQRGGGGRVASHRRRTRGPTATGSSGGRRGGALGHWNGAAGAGVMPLDRPESRTPSAGDGGLSGRSVKPHGLSLTSFAGGRGGRGRQDSDRCPYSTIPNITPKPHPPREPQKRYRQTSRVRKSLRMTPTNAPTKALGGGGGGLRPLAGK